MTESQSRKGRWWLSLSVEVLWRHQLRLRKQQKSLLRGWPRNWWYRVFCPSKRRWANRQQVGLQRGRLPSQSKFGNLGWNKWQQEESHSWELYGREESVGAFACETIDSRCLGNTTTWIPQYLKLLQLFICQLIIRSYKHRSCWLISLKYITYYRSNDPVPMRVWHRFCWCNKKSRYGPMRHSFCYPISV